jgi:hypothetical protein
MFVTFRCKGRTGGVEGVQAMVVEGLAGMCNHGSRGGGEGGVMNKN